MPVCRQTMREMVESNPVLAILRNVPLEKTLDYAGAVIRGGVRFFEVALNSPNALKQISLLRDALGEDCLVGAGTAITTDLCRSAMDAGAQFLLTPGTPDSVLAYCAKNGIELLPGVLTPTDVARCLEYGFSTMKLFPAGDMPLKYIKSLKGPFDGTDYVAIGGVNPGNVASFFAAGYLGVGLSGGLAPKGAVQAGDWDACAESVREIVSAAGK